MSKDIKDLKESYDFFSEKYEDTKTEISNINAKIKGMSAANSTDSTQEIDNIQQYQRRNNLIITGVPEEDNEDIFQRLFSIAQALQVDLLACEIDAAHRLGRKNISGRPRGIVVKLVNRWKKEQFVNANQAFGKMKKRTLLTSDIGYSGPQTKIYLDDHLTPEMDSSAKKCRDLKHNEEIEVTYVRDCKILVKKKKLTLQPISALNKNTKTSLRSLI
ncbi:uncharacterized protein LOC113210861 [Frankliniella occidentalis]|uniref:Uncharacterized protein LOC113210861 n=1 Tax=Frankliniella occidentalis TaxID=133901 RepID=A0A6J1SU64_FRAOC|nr:uncharacterized protein LOC113210861 [Frankliniella occidentalis]